MRGTTATIKRDESVTVKLLAALLMICSLILLNQSLLTERQEQNKTVPESSAQKKVSPERMVRVITLPEPEEKAPPKKEAPAQVNSSKDYVEGHTPAIEASFSMPIKEYVQILEKQAGAKLVLFDTLDRKILGIVSGSTLVSHKVNLNGISMRTRNITSDLPASFRNKLLKQSGTGHPVRFLIMLPKKSDHYFEQTLADHAAVAGVTWNTINSIALRYVKVDEQHIHAVIQSVTTKDAVTRIGKSVRIW